MKIKIEIESLGNDGVHLFCKVKVNGLKCRALIDTGASKTVISRELSELLNLTDFISPADNQLTGIHPGEMEVTFAQIKKIAFKNLVFKNILTGLIDIDHVKAQYTMLKIEPPLLILGGDILNTGLAVIDYKNKVLKLQKP
jgi:predicted aspartyl protease